MNKWLELPKERREQILNQVSALSGILPHAIEKDWWVTITLKAIFLTAWQKNLVFKGGTSLTKSWKLIERFSEDIDLAIDKGLLGFEGEANKSKVERLRRAASSFVTHEFKDGLQKSLLEQGIPDDQFIVSAQFSEDSNRDPQILELSYFSVLESNPNPYLKEKVIIEVGARSLMEPSSQREIKSIISENLSGSSFAEPGFMIQCVDPERTFLEKIFLLHEIFTLGNLPKVHERMSRHLYDVERLMDTPHGENALNNKHLYQEIIAHRKAFNKVSGVDYDTHLPSSVNFIPEEGMIAQWENDYHNLQINMIYGSSLPFNELLARLKLLRERFRAIN